MKNKILITVESPRIGKWTDEFETSAKTKKGLKKRMTQLLNAYYKNFNYSIPKNCFSASFEGVLHE